VWCYTPIIPALRRLKQENFEFEVSLGYVARPYLGNKIKSVHAHITYKKKNE
jgi:hypothetical protein